MFTLFTGDIIMVKTVLWWKRPFIKWGHGALYKASDKIIESTGRGVLETHLFDNYYNREIMVLRVKTGIDDAFPIRIRALQIAEDTSEKPSALYDYYGVFRYVIPRLLARKLFKRDCSFGYHPDRLLWCFELIRMSYARAGLLLFSMELAPIDIDFLRSPYLVPVWTGLVNRQNLSST
jgi:hypothetical protein